MQLDPGYTTGAWAVMGKAMNVLQMIKQQHDRAQRLSEAQFLMSKTYRGTDYTSAHQAPVLENHPSLCYRGQGYIK